MNGEAERRVERAVSRTLLAGCLLSSALLILGLCLLAAGSPQSRAVLLAGVAAVIFTPVARSVLLAWGYARSGEYLFSALAAFVAAVILYGAF